MATYKQYIEIIDIPTQAAEERLAVEEWNMYGSSRLGVLSKEELIASRIGVWNGSAFVPGVPDTYTINGLPTTDVFDEQVGFKTYELSNHLGNVLATITDRKVPDIDMPNSIYNYYNPQITTITDYYPFGMQIEERSWVASSSSYRFGFQGQEKDNEMKGDGNSLDFGARIYDSRLGRFLSVDPLFKKYIYLSSYSFAANNPIKFIDKNDENPSEPTLLEEINLSYKSQIKIYNIVRDGAIRDRAFFEAKGDYVAASEVYVPMAITPIMKSLFLLRAQEAKFKQYDLDKYVEYSSYLTLTGAGRKLLTNLSGKGLRKLFASAKKRGGNNFINKIAKNPHLNKTPTQLEKSRNSFLKQKSKHKRKLDDYKNNPDGFDNKGRLKNAKNEEERKKIIQGRINRLEKEIKKFDTQIKQINEITEFKK